ncbi:MAG: hypothetical protein AB7L65_00960 [Hyphomonadaceae bacterium]
MAYDATGSAAAYTAPARAERASPFDAQARLGVFLGAAAFGAMAGVAATLAVGNVSALAVTLAVAGACVACAPFAARDFFDHADGERLTGAAIGGAQMLALAAWLAVTAFAPEHGRAAFAVVALTGLGAALAAGPRAAIARLAAPACLLAAAGAYQAMFQTLSG